LPVLVFWVGRDVPNIIEPTPWSGASPTAIKQWKPPLVAEEDHLLL
jgi:hypothetical protein